MPEKKHARDKGQETSDKQPSSGAQIQERLKVVVRRLPPNLPEDIFWNSVKPWVTEDSTQWKTFCSGKLVNRPNKENVLSRAYIAFRTEDQIAAFSQGYDGHLFRDKAGNESYAVVEFAPYQKIPPERKKNDARNGTIETDEDYISFIESLKQSNEATESTAMDQLCEPAERLNLNQAHAATVSSVQPASLPTTTPLLEALKAEKSAKNDKEAILRNHAHYKEHAGDSKKEEGKKKAPPAPKSEQKLSKKAKKAAAAAAAAAGPSTSAPSPKVILPSQAHAKATATPPPNTPKAPRAARQRQTEAKAAAPVAADSRGQVITDSVANAPTAAPARRSRPVVSLGGAARHFEAALSGAVGSNPKVRREDKNATPDTPTTAAEGTSPAPALPTSPRKNRSGKRPSDTKPLPKMGVLQKGPDGEPQEVASPSGPSRRGRGRGRGMRGHQTPNAPDT